MEGEASREGGERREGEGVGCEEKPTACAAERKKEDIEKGKGGADRDNEKGKRREQKASAIRRGKRMRNVCAGGRCVVCARLGVCTCVNACMCVWPLTVRRTDWKE